MSSSRNPTALPGNASPGRDVQSLILSLAGGRGTEAASCAGEVAAFSVPVVSRTTPLRAGLCPAGVGVATAELRAQVSPPPLASSPCPGSAGAVAPAHSLPMRVLACRAEDPAPGTAHAGEPGLRTPCASVRCGRSQAAAWLSHLSGPMSAGPSNARTESHFSFYQQSLTEH